MTRIVLDEAVLAVCPHMQCNAIKKLPNLWLCFRKGSELCMHHVCICIVPRQMVTYLLHEDRLYHFASQAPRVPRLLGSRLLGSPRLL